ncbi:MAG: hypothetical protein AB1847_23390 [bacterium]
MPDEQNMEMAGIKQELSIIYTEWDDSTRTLVLAEDAKIDFYKNQADIIIIEVGKSIKAVRDALRHNKKGGFEGWIEKRHNISRRQAYNLINVAENFKLAPGASLEMFQTKALYKLASPSTPEPARTEALILAESGERVTHAKAQEIIAKHKAEAEAAKREAASKQQALFDLDESSKAKLQKLEAELHEAKKERDQANHSRVKIVANTIQFLLKGQGGKDEQAGQDQGNRGSTDDGAPF